MKIEAEEITSWDSKYRLKFINSVSGYKGVHLIGTASEDGKSNLGLFNSIVHISSSPAQLGFILRPNTVRRDTYNNILATGHYTINQVHKSFLERAHFTSAKFEEEDSEFEKCNLEPLFKNGFHAPSVAESNVQIGLKLSEDIFIPGSECSLIVGEILFIDIAEELVQEDGQLDFEEANSVCVTGLNQYSSVKKFKQYPYARVDDLPNFYRKERPDNTAFDKESQTYNASLLPYGTNIGAPSIKTGDLSIWKNRHVSGFNHAIQNKVDRMKAAYEELVEEYKINEMLYGASFDFEPIIGQTYHLYSKENLDDHFLSLIPPHTWAKPYIGSFALNSDQTWEQREIEDQEK